MLRRTTSTASKRRARRDRMETAGIVLGVAVGLTSQAAFAFTMSFEEYARQRADIGHQDGEGSTSLWAPLREVDVPTPSTRDYVVDTLDESTSGPLTRIGGVMRVVVDHVAPAPGDGDDDGDGSERPPEDDGPGTSPDPAGAVGAVVGGLPTTDSAVEAVEGALRSDDGEGPPQDPGDNDSGPGDGRGDSGRNDSGDSGGGSSADERRDPQTTPGEEPTLVLPGDDPHSVVVDGITATVDELWLLVTEIDGSEVARLPYQQDGSRRLAAVLDVPAGLYELTVEGRPEIEPVIVLVPFTSTSANVL